MTQHAQVRFIQDIRVNSNETPQATILQHTRITCGSAFLLPTSSLACPGFEVRQDETCTKELTTSPMSKREVLRNKGEVACLSVWSGRDYRLVLGPVQHSDRVLSTEFLSWCCKELANRDVGAVYTPALTPKEAEPFYRVGFGRFDSLWLLTKPLRGEGFRIADKVSGVRTARARRRHLGAVELIDRASFSDFWNLDIEGILDARAATRAGRFVVALSPEPVGYAITGWGSNQAYLQRVAVLPEYRRRGIARDLVIDALRASRRRGSRQMLVNTQVGNDSALALYRSLGFVLQPEQLVVLRKPLRPSPGELFDEKLRPEGRLYWDDMNLEARS